MLRDPPAALFIGRSMLLGKLIRPHPESSFETVARTKQIAHIDDVRTRRPYIEGDEANVKFVDLTGARTVLAVPMLQNDELLGLIAIFRQEVRPFTERQIELATHSDAAGMGRNAVRLQQCACPSVLPRVTCNVRAVMDTVGRASIALARHPSIYFH